MARGTHAAAILGPELYSRLPNTRVLLVGAGGIGCELRESPPSHTIHATISHWIAFVAPTSANAST